MSTETSQIKNLQLRKIIVKLKCRLTLECNYKKKMQENE